MATIAPITHIELTESQGKIIPRMAGTRIRVSEVVTLYIKEKTPLAWILENYESLDAAKVYAASAYYYDHQAEIESKLARPVPASPDLETFVAQHPPRPQSP